MTRHTSRAVAVLVVVIWALSAGVVRAQTINPTTAEFVPSADHDTTMNGVPVVSHYELNFYLVGETRPFQVMNLGKPAPSADGTIRTDFTALLIAPSPGDTYEARVSAVGPEGTATSSASNTFSFAECLFTVSPTGHSVEASGGSRSSSVTTTSGCSWTATSAAPWISISGGSSGTTSGSATYSVAANTSGAVRNGTLAIAGQTVTVTQTGTACAVALSPTTQSFSASGGSGTVAVTATAGCTWEGTSNRNWIRTVPDGGGAGNGTLTYSVEPNTSNARRTGALTIGGKTVTVSQSKPSASSGSKTPRRQR